MLLVKNFNVLSHSQLEKLMNLYSKLFTKAKNQLILYLEKNYLQSFKHSRLSTTTTLKTSPTIKFESVKEMIQSNDTIILKKFSTFLKGCFAEENLKFVLEVQRYKEKLHTFQNSKESVSSALKSLHCTFLVEGAEQEVNLPESMRKELVDKIQKGEQTPFLFQTAEKEILQLLDQNFFQKFLNVKNEE